MKTSARAARLGMVGALALLAYLPMSHGARAAAAQEVAPQDQMREQVSRLTALITAVSKKIGAQTSSYDLQEKRSLELALRDIIAFHSSGGQAEKQLKRLEEEIEHLAAEGDELRMPLRMLLDFLRARHADYLIIAAGATMP